MVSRLLIRWSPLEVVFRESGWSLRRKMSLSVFRLFLYFSCFMSYEYQLEGRDDGWIAITGRSEVTYYDLPSGSYVFKVRRMGEPDSETLLKVEIASVFSGWLAWGIVVAVLLAGGGYYFFGRGKRQAPEQVQVVKEEQSVAVETKSVSEEKYKSVKVSSEECRRLTDKLEKSCIKTSFISILI